MSCTQQLILSLVVWDHPYPPLYIRPQYTIFTDARFYILSSFFSFRKDVIDQNSFSFRKDILISSEISQLRYRGLTLEHKALDNFSLWFPHCFPSLLISLNHRTLMIFFFSQLLAYCQHHRLIHLSSSNISLSKSISSFIQNLYLHPSIPFLFHLQIPSYSIN